MKTYWLVFVIIAGILIKENLCVPAIRPLSQRGIIFPVDNWDDCFLDEASRRPGLCKKLEECPEVLKKWDKENIYPKTCYFIKKQQFVCCPPVKSFSTKKPENIFHENTIKPTKIPDIFNTDSGAFTQKPNIINTSIFTERPSNIFLDNIKDGSTPTTTTSTKRPSNIFLDKLTTEKTTTKIPSLIMPDIFDTKKPPTAKSRSELECDLQNQYKFETISFHGTISKQNEFSFMAALGWKSDTDNKIWYPCGGVLISPNFVLTAAHCADIGGERPLFVHLGGDNLTDSEEGTIKIKQFILYPGYNVSTIYNDIALVELEEEAENPPACLWNMENLPITKLTALGYGHISFGDQGSNQLLKASLTAIDKAECQEFYKQEDKLQLMDIVDTHLCAGDMENISESCQGDSGGPLIMELDKIFYVVGITSYGLGCAELPPSIYTRVSSFIDWIEPIVWPEIDVRIDRNY